MKSREPKIGKMFVVHRVKKVLLQKIYNVGNFNNKDPVFLQKVLYSARKRVNIVHMSKDIGRCYYIGWTVFLAYFARESNIPKLGERWNAVFSRNRRYRAVRLHAERFRAFSQKRFKQNPIV